jgi:hypothetical protein
LLPVFLLLPAAFGQTATSSIAGSVFDAATKKPIPAAWVTAIRSGLPPLSVNTKSGGAGEFQIQGLAPGTYSLCVQTPDQEYLDPCQWNGSPMTVTLTSGQAAAGISLSLAGASVLNIQIQDAQKVLSQRTRDGRRPELSVGVWGPSGLYYPARALAASGAGGMGQEGLSYQVAVPRGLALRLHVVSRDLQLADSAGKALAGNVSQLALLLAADDFKPRNFTFTVLGLLP